MTDDLFQWLDALYTKEPRDGTPPMYVMHRFMASDRDYVEACRELGRDLREPDLIFHTWRGLLPVGKGAPRFSYVAPKKPPAEEALVQRLMRVEGERRSVCEQMVEVFRLAERLDEAYHYYGVEVPEEEMPERPATGLLA